jgi:putative ABC transport system ATP-binding protein
MNSNYSIEVKSLSKSFGQLGVVKDLSFQVPPKEFLAIQGPSGSGKSTLLGLLAGLDRPDSGNILINQTEIGTMNEDRLALFRRLNIGFVFQAFYLIPTLNVVENVAFPLFPERIPRKEMMERAKKVAESVGLGQRLKHYPNQLSGGEQQRVAIARSLINNPGIILADEPTGNLDSENGKKIIELLYQLNHEKGLTLVLVTHDDKIAAQSNRIIRLVDGRIDNENSKN